MDIIYMNLSENSLIPNKNVIPLSDCESTVFNLVIKIIVFTCVCAQVWKVLFSIYG